jgi:hypothetical protein
LARALDKLLGLGMRYELARTWEVMASLEPAAGQAARARERALRLYRETGARADARRLEATLTARLERELAALS